VKIRIVSFLFLFVLPVTAFAQTTLNFPRQLTTAELAVTGFAVVNPSSAAATVTYTLRNSGGVTVGGPSAIVIPARGQRALLGNEIFVGASQSGWVQATSTTTGLTGFWLSGNLFDVPITFLDGAEAAPAAQGAQSRECFRHSNHRHHADLRRGRRGTRHGSAPEYRVQRSVQE
jgi:hypothetical protein